MGKCNLIAFLAILLILLLIPKNLDASEHRFGGSHSRWTSPSWQAPYVIIWKTPVPGSCGELMCGFWEMTPCNSCYKMPFTTLTCSTFPRANKKHRVIYAPTMKIKKLGEMKHFRNEYYRNGFPKVQRSEAAKRKFLRQFGLGYVPPGYEIDHIIPLHRGGSRCSLEYAINPYRIAQD